MSIDDRLEEIAAELDDLTESGADMEVRVEIKSALNHIRRALELRSENRR